MSTRPSKRLRFEIFRRDNHACRYCGKTAPDAELTVDHVVPVALGGTDEPGNLVTACVDCNAGKSASAPDATLVADVSADAIRWGRAIKAAAEILTAGQQANQAIHDQFFACWDNWHYGFHQKPLPLPANWRQSVDNFIAAGLPVELLCECVNLAMSRPGVTADNTFRYMCGIAWGKVRELQDLAQTLVVADEAASADAEDEPLPPPVNEAIRRALGKRR